MERENERDHSEDTAEEKQQRKAKRQNGQRLKMPEPKNPTYI